MSLVSEYEDTKVRFAAPNKPVLSASLSLPVYGLPFSPLEEPELRKQTVYVNMFTSTVSELLQIPADRAHSNFFAFSGKANHPTSNFSEEPPSGEMFTVYGL
jgi:hypothetical protein